MLIRYLSLLIFLAFVCCKEKIKDDEKISSQNPTATIEQEAGRPWNKAITKKALLAIEKSVNNIKQNSIRIDSLFPSSPGPYNIPFSLDTFPELEFAGHGVLSKNPKVYEILFRKKGDASTGPRVTVDVNLETEEAIRVYMQ